ncbi:unnamed protein product [Prunus armeniaca]|uniref:Uncharacterized protein n=1 Tax=Prunus armeniaca TaxID=36596 RepID=A0A6J5Y776_PRUAR|nr:unnamed protein product [Prunus armeniaca]
MANSLVIGLRILFAALGCVMVLTLTYTLSTDGLPFRKDLLTPWMAATLVDFYINVVPLAIYFFREEYVLTGLDFLLNSALFGYSFQVQVFSCRIRNDSKRLGFPTRSQTGLVQHYGITTCAYILLQFMKLSTQESQDPMYYVLLRHSNKCDMENKNKLSPVWIARVLFSALGLLMLGTLLYTLLTDGTPFRTELLTPWMTATLIDFYINVVALSYLARGWGTLPHVSTLSGSCWGWHPKIQSTLFY